MKAKKQRKIENQPDDYLYKENKSEVTFTEFVKLELILFFCSLPIPCDSEYCGRIKNWTTKSTLHVLKTG